MEKNTILIVKGARSRVLDITKGIGIVLVVWAHARGPFSRYLYLFHMPLFFLISGYLFNRHCSLKEFILKKIKSLYIPFIAWNILGGIVRWGLGEEAFTPYRFLKYVVKVCLTLTKDGQFFGASWFLGALFVVSILYKILDSSLEDTKQKRIFLTFFFACIALAGFSIDFKFMLSRTMILSMFFAIGVWVRDNEKELKKLDCTALTAASFFFFMITGYYNSVNMGKNEYTYPLLFVIGALAASYVTIQISRIIDQYGKKAAQLFSFLGKRSMDIVIWQFVSFRFIIFLQLLMDQAPISTILDYYPVYSTSHGWWCWYLLCGLCGSLAIGWVLRAGTLGNLLKKIHIVS